MNNPQIPTLGSELAPILQLVKVILDFLDQVEIILLLKTQLQWDVAAILSIELDGSWTGVVVI